MEDNPIRLQLANAIIYFRDLIKLIRVFCQGYGVPLRHVKQENEIKRDNLMDMTSIRNNPAIYFMPSLVPGRLR